MATLQLDQRTLTCDSSLASIKLGPGHHTVEYNDATHLTAEQWIQLGVIDVRQREAQNATLGASQAYYTFELNVKSPRQNEITEKHSRTLHDLITQSLIRCGLAMPLLQQDSFSQLSSLGRHESLLLVPDTNALTTGTLMWLLRAFHEIPILISPLAISLAQAQQRAEKLKYSLSQPKMSEAAQSLRSRNLVNSTISCLERLRDRYLIVEVDPQLLRYSRASGKGSSDPDQTDYLEDRLLIETVHQFFSTIRSHMTKAVVTSDTLLARILQAEAINTVYLQIPTFASKTLYPCRRFDAFARKFEGAPYQSLLWDLTHTFSRVRLTSTDGTVILLDAYWPGKSASDWRSEKLMIQRVEDHQELNNRRDLSDDAKEVELIEADVPSPTEADFAFSKASIPEIGPLSLARVAERCLRDSPISPSKIISRGKAIGNDVRILRSLEVLRRAALIEVRSANNSIQLYETTALKRFVDAICIADLDAASELLSKYDMYRELLRAIAELSNAVPKSLTAAILKRTGKIVSASAVERLSRLSEALGQSWTYQSSLYNGAARPSLNEIEQAFQSAFHESQKDGIAQISDLTVKLSLSLHTSPWNLQRQIEALLERGGLQSYIFQPSIGSGRGLRYKILAGKNGSITESEVLLDRLIISDRPIFSVARK